MDSFFLVFKNMSDVTQETLIFWSVIGAIVKPPLANLRNSRNPVTKVMRLWSPENVEILKKAVFIGKCCKI